MSDQEQDLQNGQAAETAADVPMAAPVETAPAAPEPAAEPATRPVAVEAAPVAEDAVAEAPVAEAAATSTVAAARVRRIVLLCMQPIITAAPGESEFPISNERTIYWLQRQGCRYAPSIAVTPVAEGRRS